MSKGSKYTCLKRLIIKDGGPLNWKKETRFVLPVLAVLSGSLLYQNCAPTGNIGEPSSNLLAFEASLKPLTLAPSAITLGENGVQQFVPTGGYPPYTFKVTGGTGKISTTGIFTAPAANEADVIVVGDATGLMAQATVIVSSSVTTGTGTTIMSTTPTPTPTPAPSDVCSMTNPIYFYSGTTGGVGDLGNSTEASLSACATYCQNLHAAVCEYEVANTSCKAWSPTASATLSAFPGTAGTVYSGTCTL
jgi:hypothetical protein